MSATSTRRQITYRLQAEGKTEVLRDQREIAQGWRGTYDAAEAGAAKAGAAAERLERRYRAMAQAARESEQGARAQSRFNAMLGVDTGAMNSARDSAAVFEQMAAAEERAEARARALKAALDPLGAAQDRLNDELREYQLLANAGKISTDQLARAQIMARTRFDETAAAVSRNERGITRLALASRVNLARQAPDVLVTAAMGMSPAMIALQQGPQILDAFATSAIKLNGPLVMLAGAVAAVAGATAVLGTAWLSGEKSSLAYDRAVSGVGRTSRMTAAELRAAAEAGAEAGQVSLATAREWATAFASTGKVGAEVTSGLVAIMKDYSSFVGRDAVDAQKSLEKAMADPAKAAVEMTREFGLLDQKTIDHIESLDKLGDRQAAQKVLLEALSEAVAGHGAKVGELTSFWDVAARSMSNYWTKLGEWLHTTRDEEIENLKLRRDIAATPMARRAAESKLFVLEYQRDWNNRTAADLGAEAAANQAAQEARDRAKSNRSGRSSGSSEAAREERERREALQRARREEDRAASLDLEVAQLTRQTDLVRQLEDEERLRRRVRELEDDGVAATAARQQAEAEMAPLLAARGDALSREREALEQAARLDVMREARQEEASRAMERSLDLTRRTEAYRKAGLGVATELAENGIDLVLIDQAAAAARQDMLAIDEARLKVMQGVRGEAEAEHALTLARLRGDDAASTRLDIEARLRRRAREIERREGWNEGDERARDQSQSEIQQELDAEATGARRTWLRGLLADINRGDLRDAVANQLLKAGDRLLDKLIDGFMSLDLSGGKGGGIGGWISSAANFLFGGKGVGKNAEGTDFWGGGPTWVGERGPELLFAPRGSRIVEHNRSLQMAAAGGGRAAAPPVNFTFAPQIDARGAGPREVDALSARMDQMAAQLRGEMPSMVADALQRRQID